MRFLKLFLIVLAVFSSFMTVKTFSCSIQREEINLSLKSFRAKVKTKSGGIIGNVSVQATDSHAAEYKIKKKYPECTILSLKEVK